MTGSFLRLGAFVEDDLERNACPRAQVQPVKRPEVRSEFASSCITPILKIGVVVFVGISPQGFVVFETVMLAFARCASPGRCS